MSVNDAITLLNMNMLYLRYYDRVERELHLPLGCLYLTRVLEEAGERVDLRDYQLCPADDPFDAESICDYLEDSAPLVGVSVMANLLPFAICALRRFKDRHPDRTVVLGGVGPASVEEQILRRFPWIDAVAYGEGERMIVPLVRAHRGGSGFSGVPNLVWRRQDGQVVRNAPAPRVEDLDTIPFPAWHRVDLSRYEGLGIMTSRGCPYPCTFCSVAPIWGRAAQRRSDENIIEEMRRLKKLSGADLFLFQDEYFVCTPRQVQGFCDALERAHLGVDWKAFGRINLADRPMMERMASTGCLELRFGVESGSDEVLARAKKGFTAEDAVAVVGEAVGLFDRVDAFYVWGYPHETMEQFQQSVMQMVAFRLMGARILPSLLCFLPQTDIFKEFGDNGRALEPCRELLPEYMLTGHEVCQTARVSVEPEHAHLFDFIEENPNLFPGFFHYDLEGNVMPKLRVLQEMGFYPADTPDLAATDSCGAHSPRVAQATTARAQLRP